MRDVEGNEAAASYAMELVLAMHAKFLSGFDSSLSEASHVALAVPVAAAQDGAMQRAYLDAMRLASLSPLGLVTSTEAGRRRARARARARAREESCFRASPARSVRIAGFLHGYNNYADSEEPVCVMIVDIGHRFTSVQVCARGVLCVARQ